MLFNSFDFALFLPTVFLLHWFVFKQSRSSQNGFIAAASYVFYAWWDWRFLSLILFSTVLDYSIGIALQRSQRVLLRKALLIASLTGNLGLLFTFKYHGFFVESLGLALSSIGFETSLWSLNVILPVGISFYTFQTLSYSIDVYRRKIPACSDPLAYVAYVSFFPQLVAGPIERAAHLLPQFERKREFSYTDAVDGMRQILWGLFKKMVIADNCAIVVDQVFEDYNELNASALLLGIFLFSFQIYGDFSGYSDIAIGTARLFGVRLQRNFAYPYFSRDIAEFWRRWHISLSSWFRDYVYIPLGGSRCARWKCIRNVMLTFLISGFWHGANWTFIAWGAFHGLLFLPLLLREENRKHMDTPAANRFLPTFRETAAIMLTFSLVMLGWVFFRSPTLGDAFAFLGGMLEPSLLELPNLYYKLYALKSLLLIIVFVAIEWFGRRHAYAIEGLSRVQNPFLRYFAYFCLTVSVLWFAALERNAFIYFQF